MKITFIIDSQERAFYFKYLGLAAQAKGIEVEFLCYHYYSYLILKRIYGTRRTFLIHRFKGVNIDKQAIDLYSICEYDHLAKNIKIEDCQSVAYQYVIRFEEYFLRYRPDIIVVWNGATSFQAAAHHAAKRNKITYIFMEKSNFPGFLIIDPMGTNYFSSLTTKEIPPLQFPSQLENFLQRYHRAKEKFHYVPEQAITMRMLIDGLVHFLYKNNPLSKFISADPYQPLKTLAIFLRRHINNKLIELNYNKNVNLPQNFIFLPLQVHNDSSLILHSHLYKNNAEIVEACLKALPPQFTLIVKDHPADRGVVSYKRIENLLKAHEGLFLPQANTFSLLKHCKALITINSTTGLEGLTYYKPIVVLGKAPYAGKGFTYDLNAKDQLSELLLKAVSEEPHKEKITCFLHYYLFTYLTKGDYRAPNIENSQEAILKILKIHEENKSI